MAVSLPPLAREAEPVRTTPLPFYRPHISAAECAAVVRTLQSGWLTTGQECAAFELELAHYWDVPHVAALNSCTAGLHLGLLAAGIGPGDWVATSPLTFCASVNVIEHVGARPYLVDVDPATGCLDPALLPHPTPERPIRCLLPVHFAGTPCDLLGLRSYATAHGVPVLSDCAHAVETRVGGRSLAAWSDLAAYSFYATKNLTTGEGGALTAHDAAWADRIRTLRLHGMSKDAHRRYEPGASPLYDVTEPGFKYNLTDPAAALGRCQLAALENHWERRAAIVAAYFTGLTPLIDAEACRILLPHPSTQTPADRAGYHLCPLILSPDRWGVSRNELVGLLAAEGIGTSVHFTPVHELSFYARKYGWAPGDFPHAHALGASEISLPLHPWLTDQDVADVIAALHRLWSRHQR